MAEQETSTGYTRLGEALVAQGVINEEQLQDAIDKQQSGTGGMEKRRLGEVLVRLGYISKRKLSQGLARQLGITPIKLDEIEIPATIINAVRPEIAQIYKIVPVDREEGVLQVATADPTDVEKLDNLERLLDMRVEPLLSTEDDIREALRKYYNASLNTVQSMLSTMSSVSTISGLSSLSGLSDGSSLSGSHLSSLGSDFASAGISSISVDSMELDSFDVPEDEKQKKDDEKDPGDAPVIKYVHQLIIEAIRQRASDIHIEPFRDRVRIRYRIDGVCREQNAPPKAYQKAVVSRIKIMAGLDISEKRLPHDGRIKLNLMSRPVDLRVSTIPSIFGEGVAMRVLDKSSLLIGLEDLGFTADHMDTWNDLLQIPNGVILVTGPTGCGKTTTLYASLHKLNREEVKIITIEDPIEYMVTGLNQVMVKEAIGLTFGRALRSILRQDPDIVLVGEVRDGETAETAIRSSLTGHLVFSTLHTNDSSEAITRLLDMGVAPFLLSASLRAVLAQRLIRLICQNCKEAYTPSQSEVDLLATCVDVSPGIELYRGAGCENCGKTGFLRRIGMYELLPVDQEIQDMILRRGSTQDVRKRAIELGMKSLRVDGFMKVLDGLTTLPEVLRQSHDTELAAGLTTDLRKSSV